jgi:hypothetical protein
MHPVRIDLIQRQPSDLLKNEKLFLDDLAVGAEFKSEKYAVDPQGS